VPVELLVARAVVDEQEAAGLQVVLQRRPLLGAELRVAEAGQIQERVRRQLSLRRVNIFEVEVDRQRRIAGQLAQPLVAAVRVGVPVALVAQLGERELLPATDLRPLQLVRHRLHLGHLPQRGDVADDVHAQADGVAGDHGPAARRAGHTLLRRRRPELVPAAAHVGRREHDRGARAQVHAEDLRRPLARPCVPLGHVEIMHVGVPVERPEDRVVHLQHVEGAVGEHCPDLVAERLRERRAAQRGVADQGAAVDQVLPQRGPLVVAEAELLVARQVQGRQRRRLARLVHGHQFVEVQHLPAVPKSEFGSRVAHQVVDVAGVGHVVLRVAVHQLGDEQRRRRLGLRLAAAQRHSR
jgi:hypothetical protein